MQEWSGICQANVSDPLSGLCCAFQIHPTASGYLRMASAFALSIAESGLEIRGSGESYGGGNGRQDGGGGNGNLKKEGKGAIIGATISIGVLISIAGAVWWARKTSVSLSISADQPYTAVHNDHNHDARAVLDES